MQNFKFLAVFSIMMLLLQGLYAQYEGQVDINPADVNTEQTDGWDIATIPGCYMEMDVGKPYLPVKHLHIAIPEDKAVVQSNKKPSNYIELIRKYLYLQT